MSPDPSRHGDAAALAAARYDLNAVAHARRWRLDQPDARYTRAFAVRLRERTLVPLAGVQEVDMPLYLFRLMLVQGAMDAEVGQIEITGTVRVAGRRSRAAHSPGDRC